MSRKTNLFYGVNVGNRFITFSNYAESLTGNFLATDAKVFPSAFICLYSPRLDQADSTEKSMNAYNNLRKQLQENSLIARYENKLAFFRDAYKKEKKPLGDNVKLLNYLWEALSSWDKDISIVYVDNITEQDYNGTYTDTICLIDMVGSKTGIFKKNESTDRESIIYDAPQDMLYGWYDTTIDGELITYKYNGPTIYKDVKPSLDRNNAYMVTSDFLDMELIDNPEADTYLKFNMIVPLYDVFLTDEYDTNVISTIVKNDASMVSTYTRNVPLGVYFTGMYPVELRRNGNQNYAPTWSLVIGSQFKPFPYSGKMPNEISRDSVGDAFSTFAQVLSRQNIILDKFESINTQVKSLSDRIESLESRINRMGTQTNIDELRADISNIKDKLNF